MILDVEVIFNTNFKFKKFQVESFEEDARFKLIYNRMRFDSFLILFKSLERQNLIIKNIIFQRK